jgi:hypothetical protein
MGSKDTRTKAEKIMDLANAPSATAGERANAREAAARLREKKLRESLDDNYRQLVRQGKDAHHKREEMNWILGELASKVEKQYGKASLQRYAGDIGINYTTLRHCRATFEAWKIGGRPPFWTAYALNSHPDRSKIVREHPNLTHQQAQNIVAKYKQEKRQKQGKPPKAKKAKGKNKDNPYPVSGTSKFVIIVDSLFGTRSNLQSFIEEIKPTEEERAQIIKALEGLRKRVDEAIGKVKS